MAEGRARVRKRLSSFRDRHGYRFLSRSASAPHDDSGAPGLLNVSRLLRSVRIATGRSGRRIRGSLKSCGPALPENGDDRSRSGSVCRASSLSIAFLSVAELPATLLGG